MADGDIIALLAKTATRMAGPVSFGPESEVFLGISEKGIIWSVTLDDSLSPLFAALEPNRIAELSSIADDPNPVETVLAVLSAIRGISDVADALTTLPDVDLGPPERVAISIDTGPVGGGGYLAEEDGEYIGALELEFGGWGIKAVGVLSNVRLNGRTRLALLLLLYADLPRFHIAFNIFFEGIGGVLGLQRGADSDAIQAGLSGGHFDDILFPANPVQDARRIIDRSQVIFPLREGAFLIGPMFRLTWSTPVIADIKLGVILTVDNLLGGDGPVRFNRLDFLGRLRIGLPTAQEDATARIICDFAGFFDFGNGLLFFRALLRDSYLAGGLELDGELVLQIDFGDHPAFLLAVGGFHPDFQDRPAGFPAQIKVIALGFAIGIVKVSATGYLAVTSATIQFGANVQAKATLGSVSIDGWIDFDALIYYEPRFEFLIDFDTGFTIKFKGRTLSSIQVVGTLSGPGRWHIKGRLKFSVLWWDIEKSFDEAWGSAPPIDIPATDVADLLGKAYRNRDNWSAALPAGSDALVTLSAVPEETDLLAHPRGQLRISQKVAPLGLTLEKYGESRISGPNRFELVSVKIGEQTIDDPEAVAGLEMAQEHLARGAYVHLSKEDRLAKPSFETFDVGVVFGTADYQVPGAGVPADLKYETKYLKPGEGFGSPGTVRPADLSVNTIAMIHLVRQAKVGAAASAKLRRKDKLRPGKQNKVLLGRPALALVDIDGLNEQIDLERPARSNTLLAEQRLAAAGSASFQLVEAFELE
jgi:hypothetical protein